MIATLAIPYSDTNAGDLVWTLGGALRPSLTDVVVTPEFGVHLQLCVLGSSHQVRLQVDGQELIETVACPVGAPSAEEPGLPDRMQSDEPVGRYHFDAEVRRLSPAQFVVEVDSIAALLADRGDAVIARFPGPSSAVTALAAEITQTSVGWQTWHAYPQTGELVVTASHVRRVR